METRTLHPATKARLNEIEAATGQQPTLDEVVWLNSCCQNMADASDSDYRELLEMPVIIGNVHLYPMTIGASIWWSKKGTKMFPDEHPVRWFAASRFMFGHPMANYALAFTLAHAKEPMVFAGMDEYRKAVDIIEAWARGIGVTYDSLTHAVSECLNVRNRIVLEKMGDILNRNDGESKTWVDYIASMTAVMGTDYGQWMWNHSMDTVGLIARRRAKLESDGKSFDAFDPVNIAIARVEEVTRMIIDAHKPVEAVA